MEITGKQIVAGAALLATGYIFGYKKAMNTCEKDVYKAFFNYVEDVVTKKEEGEGA